MKENRTEYSTSPVQEQGIPTMQSIAAEARPTVLSPVKSIQAHEIKLQGAFNVRDLGGYRTKSGMMVKSHLLLRSARLNHLTRSDVAVLTQQYHVGVDFDLRQPEEIQQMPDKPIPGVRYVNDPVDTDRSFHYQISVKNNRKHYRSYIANDQARKAYHHLFMTLLDKPVGKSILWHCASGKDRTGLGAALILYVLGVDGKTILKDYVASNDFLRAHNQKRLAILRENGASAGEIRHAKIDGGVDPTYLESAFDEINHEFGSVEAYIENGLHVTPEQQAILRKCYLE